MAANIDPRPDVHPVLAEVAARYREHPGLRAKRELAVVGRILGASDWISGPGDDAAAIPDGDGYLLAAGEAISPPFVEADPYGAGVAAVVANVNDVAAMGGRPLGIVDTVVGTGDVAERMLDGMRAAGRLYDVPIVGGHLGLGPGPPALSAFVVGRARRLLAAVRAEPGQVLLVAACLDGRMRPDFPFFTSIAERGERLAGDVRVLAGLAEAGACAAAKDVSMAGLLGSTAMLLEPTACGVRLHLEEVPRPEAVALPAWTAAFPTLAFLLAVPPDRVSDARGPFLERGLDCRPVGELDASGLLRARLGEEEVVLADLRREPPTGLRGG